MQLVLTAQGMRLIFPCLYHHSIREDRDGHALQYHRLTQIVNTALLILPSASHNPLSPIPFRFKTPFGKKLGQASKKKKKWLIFFLLPCLQILPLIATTLSPFTAFRSNILCVRAGYISALLLHSHSSQ